MPKTMKVKLTLVILGITGWLVSDYPEVRGQGGSAPNGFVVRTGFDGVSCPLSGCEFGAPDPTIAAGSESIVLVTNQGLALLDKSGVTIDRRLNVQLFQSVLATDEHMGGDVNVLFDPVAQRFFIVQAARLVDRTKGCVPGTCVGHMLLAVSKNTAPKSFTSEDWYVYALDRYVQRTAQGTVYTSNWGDFDHISIVGDAVVVSTKMYRDPNETPQGVNIRLIDKTKLVRGLPVSDWFDVVFPMSTLSGRIASGVMPAVTFGSSDGVFLVSRAHECSYAVWRIENPLTNPRIDFRTVGSGVPQVDCGRPAEMAVQPGGLVMYTEIGFPARPVYRSGSLWMADLVSTRTAPSGILWLEIDVRRWPDISLAQSGIIGDDGASNFHPVLTVDEAGNVVIGFNRSSLREYPSVYFAGRLFTDPRNTMRPMTVLKVGTHPVTWRRFDGLIPYGDYSDAAVDPTDGSFWLFFRDTRPPTSPPTFWDTWVSNIALLSRETLFAQFADGGGVASSLTLVNPSSSRTATGTIRFSGDDGQPLQVSLNGRQPSSTASFTLPPFGSVALTTSGIGQLRTGSVSVSSSVSVLGTVRFSLPGLGATNVGGERPLISAMVPVIRNRDTPMNTGIAIANAQALPVDVRLSLRNLAGAEVVGGSATLTLPANGHVAKFVDELFPGANTTSFEGTLVATAITTGGMISAMALQLGDPRYGEFSTLPVVAVNPPTQTTNLVFPQFVSGDGWITSVFLMSPSSGVSGEISFFDDQGARTRMSFGQNSLERLSFSVAAAGGFTAASSSTGVLDSGSARVTANGVVGGVLRFSHRSFGMAGVSPSEPITSFIAPVSRNVAGGKSSGIAIAGLDRAVTVTLTLRNREGRPVSGGVTTVRLAPNGHVAKMLEELFTNAALLEFDGVITATVDGGSVAAVALEIGSSVGTMTVLPVAPIN